MISMEHDKQHKVGLIIAFFSALFFAFMSGYFIAVKNLWMCISMAWLLISSCASCIRLNMKIKG